MPLPLLGLGLSALGGVAKKLAGKALSAATKGKLLGAGGGKELAKTLGKGIAATAGTAIITRGVNSVPTTLPSTLPSLGMVESGGRGGMRYTSSGKPYRRMNPMNVRALRKAIRRIGSAEKLFKSVFTISGGKVTPRTKRRAR